MTELRQRMTRDMRVRNFSPQTELAYINAVTAIAMHYKKSPDLLTQDQIIDYIYHLKDDRKLAWSSINVAASGLRFFYNVTLEKQSLDITIPEMKYERHLPEVLSVQQVEQIINCASNMKRRTMLMTAYAAGLRVSELVNLKVHNIESDREMIKVEQGKGKKDRYTLLSKSLLVELRQYWREYRPSYWLFPGQDPKLPLHRHSAGSAYNLARKKAGIKRGKGIHTLRHCFATHLLEMGTDIRRIQILMGHTCLATTEIYLYVSNASLSKVKSPLDLLDVSENSKKKVLATNGTASI
jgi:site-specific recombinase XerD